VTPMAPRMAPTAHRPLDDRARNGAGTGREGGIRTRDPLLPNLPDLSERVHRRAHRCRSEGVERAPLSDGVHHSAQVNGSQNGSQTGPVGGSLPTAPGTGRHPCPPAPRTHQRNSDVFQPAAELTHSTASIYPRRKNTARRFFIYGTQGHPASQSACRSENGSLAGAISSDRGRSMGSGAFSADL